MKVRTEFDMLYTANAFIKLLKSSDEVKIAQVNQMVEPDILAQGLTAEANELLTEYNKQCLLTELSEETDKDKIWNIIKFYIKKPKVKQMKRTELPEQYIDYREVIQTEDDV